MKIILSRKGFDSANGGCPSPIIGEEMISLPIPSHDDLSFSGVQYDGLSYLDMLRTWNKKGTYEHLCCRCGETCAYGCHLDPDIRKEARCNPPPGWKPAFGQIGNAQKYLKKCEVGEGDLFLFFGWFQEGAFNGAKQLVPANKRKIQAVYGYMQIGEVLSCSREGDRERIEREYPWHPHSSKERLRDKSNTLYIPDGSGYGYGLLPYGIPKQVLTLKGANPATWDQKEYPWLLDGLHFNRKNKAKHQKTGIYYQGIWQELVLDSVAATEWALELIQQHSQEVHK